MNRQLRDLLKPEVLNTVDGLELVARIIVEGFLSGSNQSQSIGIGYEFSQYRGYEPGDDLRLLDWKMYARSERYYIKQSDVETNITVKFMLDASQSMAYQEDGITKLQYTKMLMAALAYLARKQSDTFGLYTLQEENIKILEPRFEQQQFMRFLVQLVETQPHGKWPENKHLDMLYRHHGKEIILFFTDLYDDNSDILDFIFKLKTTRNEVLVFHMMGREEMSMPSPGIYTYEDLETGARLKVDRLQQKKQYDVQVAAWTRSVRSQLLQKQIDYVRMEMDQPIPTALFHFLNARKRMR